MGAAKKLKKPPYEKKDSKEKRPVIVKPKDPFMARFLENPHGGAMMSDTTTPIISGERDDTIKG